MAYQTIISLIDDIDGGKAAETISFAIDGTAYEIDLNKRNAAAMRKLFAAYTETGRAAGPAVVGSKPVRGRKPRAATAKSATSTKSNSKPQLADGPSQSELRSWAAEQGIEVSARGRIANTVRDQYLAATAG